MSWLSKATFWFRKIPILQFQKFLVLHMWIVNLSKVYIRLKAQKSLSLCIHTGMRKKVNFLLNWERKLNSFNHFYGNFCWTNLSLVLARTQCSQETFSEVKLIALCMEMSIEKKVWECMQQEKILVTVKVLILSHHYQYHSNGKKCV